MEYLRAARSLAIGAAAALFLLTSIAVGFCVTALYDTTAGAANHTVVLERHHDAVVHAARVHHAAELRRAGTLRHRSALAGAWTHIAICEEGGWIGYASAGYPDSLGITATNWFGHGGGGDLRPFVQAEVAYRIEDPPPVTCPW